VIPLVENIIHNSSTPPIIIIQSDHGAANASPPERMEILNAYYLPGGGNELLYQNISPVNTFRIIFNHYFGGDFDLLEDTSYHSEYGEVIEFITPHDDRPGCQ